jgi:hypothetical protein
VSRILKQLNDLSVGFIDQLFCHPIDTAAGKLSFPYCFGEIR